LRLVADIREGKGPNVINRENTQRRIVIGANTEVRDLETLVDRWEKRCVSRSKLPVGYYPALRGRVPGAAGGGEAHRLLLRSCCLRWSCCSYGYFRSLSLALQVMLNIPLALMGGLALTWLLIDNISIATIVGFIAVGGVAARNGIMMISHYLHLMKHEGEGFTREMIVRGTLERLVPVLMTALAAGIALIPLLLAANEPGKEILHPWPSSSSAASSAARCSTLSSLPPSFISLAARPRSNTPNTTSAYENQTHPPPLTAHQPGLCS
jgi:Cu/Ag efflux pump CusA